MHGTRTTRHDKTIPRTSGTRAGLAGAQILLHRRPRRRGRPAATCCQGVNNRTHRVARCNTTTARKCAARTCGPGATATSSAHRAKRAWETRPLRGRRTPAAAGAPRGRPTDAMHKRGTTPSRCAGTAGGPHARAHTNDGAVTTIRGTSASCASRSPILSSATTCTTSARPCRQGVITRTCTSHVHAPRTASKTPAQYYGRSVGCTLGKRTGTNMCGRANQSAAHNRTSEQPDTRSYRM